MQTHASVDTHASRVVPGGPKPIAVAQRQAVVRERELLHVQAGAVARARVGVAARAGAPLAGGPRPAQGAAAEPRGVVAGPNPGAFGDGAAVNRGLHFAAHADLGLAARLAPSVQRRGKAAASGVEPHGRLEVGERRAGGAHSPRAVFGLGPAVEDVRGRAEALVAATLVRAVVAVAVAVAAPEVTPAPVSHGLNEASRSVSEVHFVDAFRGTRVVGIRRDLDANLDPIVRLRSPAIRQNAVGFVDQDVKLHAGKKREAGVDHQLHFRLVVAWLIHDGHPFDPAGVENAARLEGVVEQVFVVAGHDRSDGQFGHVVARGIGGIPGGKAAQDQSNVVVRVQVHPRPKSHGDVGQMLRPWRRQLEPSVSDGAAARNGRGLVDDAGERQCGT